VAAFSDLDQPVCLNASEDNAYLWLRRLGHVNYRLLHKLASKHLIDGLPKLKLHKNVCGACMKSKMTRASHKPKSIISTSRPLEMIHIDLYGKLEPMSLGHKHYC
ncbi:UNVERIFIED_CONTAM: GAG-pre-integrase domain-containing protein, partial [Salmonella enterica subsp. enterica serovar Weltevreden]